MQVKIVELSEARCRFLSELLPHSTIICGDGTDQELLDSENLSSCDAFVALTDRDEDNLIISLYAAQLGLSKVITKSNRQNYNRIAQAVGLDSIISPKQLATSHILQVVRGMQNSQGSVMNALYRIADGAAEAMEFTVTASTRHLGTPLRDLSLKPGILVPWLAPGRLRSLPEGSRPSKRETLSSSSPETGVFRISTTSMTRASTPSLPRGACHESEIGIPAGGPRPAGRGILHAPAAGGRPAVPGGPRPLPVDHPADGHSGTGPVRCTRHPAFLRPGRASLPWA